MLRKFWNKDCRLLTKPKILAICPFYIKGFETLVKFIFYHFCSGELTINPFSVSKCSVLLQN